MTTQINVLSEALGAEVIGLHLSGRAEESFLTTRRSLRSVG